MLLKYLSEILYDYGLFNLTLNSCSMVFIAFYYLLKYCIKYKVGAKFFFTKRFMVKNNLISGLINIPKNMLL